MEFMTIQVTSRQREMIERAVAREGFGSVGEWLIFHATQRLRQSISTLDEVERLVQEAEERGGAIPWTPELRAKFMKAASAPEIDAPAIPPLPPPPP